jgi:stress-induced morphogen
MRRKLEEALRPKAISIWNDSAQHAGHAGAMAARHGKAGESGETHFRVEVVSDAFEGMTQVKRQRMIYKVGVGVASGTVCHILHGGRDWQSGTGRNGNAREVARPSP